MDCELSEHEGVLPSEQCDRDVFLKTYPENCDRSPYAQRPLSLRMEVRIFQLKYSGRIAFKSNMLPENLYNSQNFEVKRSHGFQRVCRAPSREKDSITTSSRRIRRVPVSVFYNYDGSQAVLGQRSNRTIGIQRVRFFW
ncbi:hypothetical protein JTB14_038335 [Gonioctena quinquepunctata]|nr:hypothetical protein JTB14_038335 [Gonioctena quinquepunctata]